MYIYIYPYISWLYIFIYTSIQVPKHQPPYLKKKTPTDQTTGVDRKRKMPAEEATVESLGGVNDISGWWQLKHFLFSSLPGEMIQFDEHIFQMGWFNHQLVSFSVLRFFWCHQIAACLLVMRVLRSYKDLKPRYFFLNAVKGISRNVRMVSGQIIATSQGLTPKGSWGREIPLFQANLGGWNSIIWPDMLQWQVFFLCGIRDPHDTTGNSLV